MSGSFLEPGTLGLKFQPLRRDPSRADGVGVKVLAINPGTQAARMNHLQAGLAAGLVLVSVQDGAGPVTRGLKQMGYKDIIGVLRSVGRPVTLQFEVEQPAQPSPSAAAAAAGFGGGFEEESSSRPMAAAAGHYNRPGTDGLAPTIAARSPSHADRSRTGV